jgi:hypothetical protein
MVLAPARPAAAQAKGSAEAAAAKRVDPHWKAPRTAWGHPDLEGIWTTDDMRGVPMSRPQQFGTRPYMTDEEFAARAKQRRSARDVDDARTGTFRNEEGSRDFSYTSMVIDPPDGRLPPLTPDGQKRAEAARRAAASEESSANPGYGLPSGPEDLSPYVRCITRGLPGMMMPIGYNNGLQITQSPGYITLTKEMIHETRVIPTRPQPAVGSELTSWLGYSQGRWDGDTLVVETTNFNGKVSFQGSSPKMKLIERYTRVAPNVLEYRFTVDDPATWAKPWTAMFIFDRDDEQYELVEYSCHEGNYGIRNILSGARAREKQQSTRPQ